MANTRAFANYPLAQEGPQVEYVHQESSNPVLRGTPLAIAASIISRASFLQSYLWANARFGTVKEIKCLSKLTPRFDPCVIPLWDGVSAKTLVPFTEAHLTPPPESQPGRYHTAADFYAAYKSGAVTPLDVIEALLPLVRRGAGNKYGTLFTTLYPQGEELVREAARASTERWQRGEPRGVLDGVPFAIKDDILVRGFVSHFGMRYDAREKFFEPSEATARPIRMLEEAGAIMVSMLNMHELGCDANGCNPAWGTPPNWHNNAYYPGGSSSGTGSACSVGLFPITIGGDAGGSIRIPSAINGIYGLKPSRNRQAVGQITMATPGPVASTVQDLIIAYRTMSQPDPEDPVQGMFAPSVPPSLDSGAKRYIGVYRTWWDSSDARVSETCHRAVEWLVSNKNYEVVPIYIPYIDVAQIAHAGTCLSEMVEAARARPNNPNDWLSMVNPATRLLLMVGAQTPAPDYIKYNAMRELLMQHMAFLFKKYPGLLVVTPTVPFSGWKRTPGDETHCVSDGNMSIKSMAFTYFANSTGCPAISVPVGYIDPEVGEGKLPVGLMAMGEWGAEEQLLAWAGETDEYLRGSVEGGMARPQEWVDVIDLAKKAKEKRGQGE